MDVENGIVWFVVKICLWFGFGWLGKVFLVVVFYFKVCFVILGDGEKVDGNCE